MKTQTKSRTKPSPKTTRRTDDANHKAVMTTEEAAEFLDISVASLNKWRSDQVAGKPAWIKIGRSVRYKRAVLEEWMASNTHEY